MSGSASGVPVENLYYLLAYAADRRPLLPPVWRDDRPIARPMDLLAVLFIEEIERLLKRGIARDYLEVSERVPGIRGRLETMPTFANALPRRGATHCTYTVYSPDTPQNRFLVTTLAALARDSSVTLPIRRIARRLRQRISAPEWTRANARAARMVLRDNRERAYAFVLHLAWMVLFERLPRTFDGEALFHAIDDGGPQWLGRLFEAFIEGFWRRHLDGATVLGSRHRQWSTEGSRSGTDLLPRLETDVEIQATHGRVIVEAKCVQAPLVGQHRSHKLSSGYVNQLYVYLTQARAAGVRVAGGVLLYATAHRGVHADLVLDGFPVRVRAVNLSAPWQEVRQQMEAIGKVAMSLNAARASPTGA